jgi:protein NRD1
MASAVTDLEAGLQAMLNLKPPGVSGSRITSLTALCVSNIQACPLLLLHLLALTIVPHDIRRPSANLISLI